MSRSAPASQSKWTRKGIPNRGYSLTSTFGGAYQPYDDSEPLLQPNDASAERIDPLVAQAVDLLIETKNTDELQRVLKEIQDPALQLHILSRLMDEKSWKPNDFVGPMLGQIILNADRKGQPNATDQERRRGNKEKEREELLIRPDAPETEGNGTAAEMIAYIHSKDSFYGDDDNDSL